MKKLNHFNGYRYIFRPSLIGTVLTLICIPLFIKFGLWQYHKAQQKQVIQTAYNQAKVADALKFPLEDINTDDWNHKKVTVTGEYETKYQILLDNQVEDNRVGYHVITPLKIAHSSHYVLINRGWILGKKTHAELPVFETPSGQQVITGQIWVPSKKIFTLEDKATLSSNNQSFKPVWQNMNMAKYKQVVPLAISAMAIKLDANSDAGGFVRNWQVPAERIATNIGYAYQWFGFAFATFLIFIYMSTTRIKSEAEIN
ncbi:MAG: SURF1 family protein [Methylotenera sp.]|nr:SURF1 family protein [Methylotenera sp.]